MGSVMPDELEDLFFFLAFMVTRDICRVHARRELGNLLKLSEIYPGSRFLHTACHESLTVFLSLSSRVCFRYVN